VDDADDRRDHTLGHLLWDVSARTAQLSEAAMAHTTLTPSTAGLLDAIASEPGITTAEIARRVPKTPQAISQTVARLEKLGYIERRLAGGRAIGLHITAAGAAAHAAGSAAEDASEARLRAALGARRYEALRQLLEEARTIIAGLDHDGE
jgi:DNA-binding MarR family transcriptional regulator